MSKVNSLLAQRMQKPKASQKMAALAKESSKGNLNTFAGMFHVTDLSAAEKEEIEQLLLKFSEDGKEVRKDLDQLISITSEVKAITNQAALLHGERIQRAQKILTGYNDGAFTAWLISTYGNRQTPYNFLQYYEFYQQVPKTLHSRLEEIPRQAVYTLASREGEPGRKHELIEQYSGHTKDQFLSLIRETFPLSPKDKRKQKVGQSAINSLTRAFNILNRKNLRLSQKQKGEIRELLEEIEELID